MPMQWQPIATAPKDGQTVLLYGRHSRHGVSTCIAAAWHGDWISTDDGYSAYIRPTHWMPLPPPPSTDSK